MSDDFESCGVPFLHVGVCADGKNPSFSFILNPDRLPASAQVSAWERASFYRLTKNIMTNKDNEEMEYIPIPKFKEDDAITLLIRRIAAVVRRWSKEELSGRQMKKDDDIDF